MAEYQTKPNTGALFGNRRKETPNQPDWNGDLYIDPALARELLASLDPKTGFIKMQMNAWTNSWSGGNYFSITVGKPFVPKPEYAQRAAPQAAPAAEVPDEDIPF